MGKEEELKAAETVYEKLFWFDELIGEEIKFYRIWPRDALEIYNSASELAERLIWQGNAQTYLESPHFFKELEDVYINMYLKEYMQNQQTFIETNRKLIETIQAENKDLLERVFLEEYNFELILGILNFLETALQKIKKKLATHFAQEVIKLLEQPTLLEELKK